MSIINESPAAHGPSKKALIKYTLASLIFAVVVLLTVVLPAEYNVDPTGLGDRLGLTVFHDTETVQTTQNVTMEEDSVFHHPEVEINVTVPAGRGVEYKFVMTQFQKLSYRWATAGVPLYFDLHGEPKGDTTGYYESYAIATLSEMKGSFTVPFDGVHGWYWKNTTTQDVKVMLIVEGQYISHGLK
jgi:hypothetical protein